MSITIRAVSGPGAAVANPITGPPQPRLRPAGLRYGAGFWSVAAAFAVIMGFSAVPTPLYGMYAPRDGFGSLTITIVYAVYAMGVILALFAGFLLRRPQ